MSSYYECTVNVSISVRPEDRECAEKCVVDATIPVLAEMGYGYSHEELTKKLDSSVCGEGKDKKTNIYLDIDDLNYNPGWDTDADAKFQGLADQIGTKLDELPLLGDGCVSIPGYWCDREPDVSGYVYLSQKKAGES